jgi:hypothetical protein
MLLDEGLGRSRQRRTRAVVHCGNTQIVLESDAVHTWIEGPFGTRELLPFPTRIQPVKREQRHAFVDC